ncbi:amino acid ABC transporter permease [Desulfospira joergensenii]|uniref:amino acid ABC transporter permease n=1 Tax=Desulfospira joergensenii TaxID=53329 RepID=UPI0003FD4A3E|nr:amino acid ABC transporter permease [Desulfospira joergensenii]
MNREKYAKFIKVLFFSGGLVFILVLAAGVDTLDYNWQWYRIRPYFFSFENGEFVRGLLLDGLVITLKISVLGLGLSMILGLSSALARLSNFPVFRALAWAYVEIIRNTPLLVQIFVIYFVISPVLEIPAFASAVIALGIFEGAYASEIIRSGIINIPKGQFEAAQSIGLSPRITYTKIIIPQMLYQTLPMLAGQSVSLIKDSALVSTISIYDLTMQGQKIVSETFLTFEIWFAVALCYLAINAGLSFVIRRLENKMKFVH